MIHDKLFEQISMLLANAIAVPVLLFIAKKNKVRLVGENRESKSRL
jgi:hypothetical protein